MRTFLYFGLALVLSGFALECLANPQSEVFYRKGEDAFKKQQFRQSLHYFRRASRVDPKDAKIFSELANVETNLDDLKSAIKDSTTAVTLDPKMVDAYVIRASAYFANEEFDNALKDANRAIDADPKRWSGWAIRSKLEREKKQWAAAISDSSKAIDLRIKRDGPAGPTSLYWERATMLTKLGKWSAAVEDLSRCIRYEDNPNKLNRFYKDRAACYEKLGRHDLAAKDIQRCNKSTQADWDILLDK